MLRLRSPWLLLTGLTALLSTGPLHAQESPPAPEPAPSQKEPPRDPNAVIPPKLLAFVDAGYPEQAKAEKLEAEVLLLLTIGSDGFVEEVSLVGPAVGYGFDELAQSAARRFVFEPAEKGGEPMRSRIRYSYKFEFQPPPEAAPEAAPEAEAPIAQGGLTLTLLNVDDGKPVADAEAYLTARSDASRVLRLVSDAQGRISAAGLEPGSYELSVSKPTFDAQIQQEEIVAGEITELVYRMSPEREEEGYGAVARIKAPPREVTRRTIEREELTAVAGTKGDALRTIELLPGVGRPPMGAGLVLIRGSAPGDSQVFLNGVQVPILYHFGGLTSFINSRALQRIDFYPGNFSARYGRQMGGIVDVATRDPATDRIRGVLDVNVPLDSSLLVEGPITKKLSFMVAGRRSYLGEILTATIPAGTFDQFAAPSYFDYQLFLNYRPNVRDKIRLSSYGSGDQLEVLFKNAPDSDPTVDGIELGLKFHRQQLGWDHRYSAKLDHTIEASVGRNVQGIAVGRGLRLNIDVTDFVLRGEWRYNVTDRVQITTGTDTVASSYEVTYRGPSPAQDNSSSGCGFTCQESVAVRESGFQVFPGAFTEVSMRPTDDLRIIPSLRLDYFSDINTFAFDPRFATIYSLTKKTRLKGGIGVFSQPPSPPQATKTLGNPNLKPARSVHYSVGFDHDFTDDLSLGMEAFYKSIDRRPINNDFVAAQDRGEIDPPLYVNAGRGRIYGLEVAGRKQAKGRWFGFLSYTLMRSMRKDHDGRWYLFDYDQTHIFAAASSVKLGKGWVLGATLRFVSGNPYTPLSGASYNQSSGQYIGEYGRVNSRRNAPFNRLDLRAEKTWLFDKWRLAAYLDIQNSYNAKNIEGTSYNFNYTESADVRGLIIIPILGVRGEL